MLNVSIELTSSDTFALSSCWLAWCPSNDILGRLEARESGIGNHGALGSLLDYVDPTQPLGRKSPLFFSILFLLILIFFFGLVA